MNVERTWPTSSAALARVIALVALVAVGSGLAGCGEDQGGNAGLPGTLIGGPFAGVSFETETLSGVTTEDGTFRYEEGETVRFFVGDTVLGETEGKGEVSPFDLVPNAEPLQGQGTISPAAFNRCDPFVSVINMATFLQTLDQDDSLDNGVDITPEITALFEGVSVNFAQRASDFRRDRDLRGALSQANEAELFESHRQIRSTAFGIQDLYASLGLDAGLFVVSRTEQDEGANDIIDSAREQEYDERAQRISSSRDDDGDGEPNSTRSTEYDEHGHPVRFESDSDGDGDADSIVLQVYNEDGDLIRVEEDDDGDGDADSVVTNSYDEIGRLLRFEADDNKSGTPNRITTYWYDDESDQNGSREDGDGDGFIDKSITNFLDENGRVIRKETDTGDDGTVNARDTSEYDARGNRTRYERDRDGDGELDDIDLYEYDEMCLRTYQEAQEGDGAVERTTTWVYDDASRRLSRATDSDADGVPDSIDTYRYDEDGNLVLYTSDDDADGTPNRTQSLEYTDGALSRGVTDQDADGTPDQIEHYTSDATEGWVALFND